MRNERTALAERIRDACLRTKLSESEIARRMGVSRALVGHWTNGRAVPTADKLAAFITVTRINGHWLLTGEGTPELLIFASAGVISPLGETPLPASQIRSTKP